MGQNKKWRFVFFAYDLIKDTKNTNSSHPSSFKSRFKRIKFDERAHFVFVENIFIIHTKRKIETTTHLYSKTGLNGLKAIETLQHNSAQNQEDITKIFQYIKDAFPADNTILFTSGHGSAFGFFKLAKFDLTNEVHQTIIDELECLRNETLEVNTQNAISELLRKKYFGLKIGRPQSNTLDILTNDELAHSIKKSFQKINVLVMNNCSMHNFHTCFSLQNAVNCLVAPAGGIVDPGYNYNAIIAKILAEPNLPDPEIASFAVKSMKTVYRTPYRKNELAKMSVFASDLAKYKVFILFFNTIIDELIDWIENNSSAKNLLIDAANQSYPFDYPMQYGIKDVIRWAEFISLSKRSDSYPQLKSMHARLEKNYKPVIIASHIGKNAYVDKNRSNCWEKREDRIPSGAIIHLPTFRYKKEEEVAIDFLNINSFFPSSFLKQTKWMDFLQRMHA